MKKPPNYSVPALEKGLDILEAFASQRQPLTLSELAQRLNRNSSEIFRMVSCLSRRGYLTRDSEAGSYRLSLRLFELAHTNSPVQELIRASQGPMRALASEVGESCHLGVLVDGDLVVVAQVETRQPVRISIEPGARFPAAETASGKLLLAWSDEDELRSVQSSSSQKLLKPGTLKTIRSKGYCLDLDATRRGVMDLAVLAGKPPFAACALTISALGTGAHTAFLRRTLPALRRAAESITLNAGFAL